MRNTEKGRCGEDRAAAYLEEGGYKIIRRNFRSYRSEVDLIAVKDDEIVFVEVKARRSRRFGNPKYAVTPKKQRKISMVALYYLKAAK